MGDWPETTARQQKILRSIAETPHEVRLPIEPDEKYLRDNGLIFYRGRTSAKEPAIGWYITEKGTRYLAYLTESNLRIKEENRKAHKDSLYKIAGLVIALAVGIPPFVTLFKSCCSETEDVTPATIITDEENNVDEDNEPIGKVAVSGEPSADSSE